MTNVTVQEALKVSIDYLSKLIEVVPSTTMASIIKQQQAALSEIGECEPVGWQFYQDGKWHNGMDTNNHKQNTIDAGLPIRELYTSLQPIEKREPAAYMYQHEETGNIGFIDQWQVDSGFEKNNPRLKIITSLYSSPQPIEKCEPVAEALHERNRLGYAVVDVIGTLDEIIENTQEAEIDDFLHIAIPIDMWNELEAALEEMPKRADLYTSPQPRDLVVPSNEVIDTLWHKATHESVAHSEPFTRYRFSELLIKQLNTKG